MYMRNLVSNLKTRVVVGYGGAGGGRKLIGRNPVNLIADDFYFLL